MGGEKKRPANNFHCFEGIGRPYWLAIAQGHRPTGVRSGPTGSRIDLEMEGDGNVVQNGGMSSPQEVKMPPGTYYRFFSTIDHNRYGGKSSMAGGWWVNYETAVTISDWADKFDMPLSAAARALLVIPNDWHDCGYVGRAKLQVTLKAWVGQGKPASGTMSPDNAARKASGGSVMAAVPLLEIKQYFVPGSRDFLGTVFECGDPVQVIAKGVRGPGL